VPPSPLKAPVNTHPYRPPIRLTSLDDTALVVKSSKELPSGVMNPRESESHKTGESEKRPAPGSSGPHVDTIQRMAELDEGHCKNMCTV
jgi:hypothetical protein